MSDSNNNNHHHHNNNNNYYRNSNNSEKRSYYNDGNNNYGDSRYGGSSYNRRNYKKRKYQNYSDTNSSYTNNNNTSSSTSSNDENGSSSNNNNNNSNYNSSSLYHHNGGGYYYNNENYISKHPFAIRNVTDYINQLSNPSSSSSSSSLSTDDNNTTTTTTTNNTNNTNNTTTNTTNDNTTNNTNNNNNTNSITNSSQNVIRNYFSNNNSKSKYRKIPKGWPQVTPLFGELIPNTKFIPLKCPLSPQYFKYPNNSSISLIQEHFNTKYSQDIGLIIDLCCVEFYKKNDLPLNMKYLSYYMNVHDLNKNLNVKSFTEQMDNIVNDIDEYINLNPNRFILIHCTHGLNRTGFVICYYLLKKKIIENVEKAIEIFKIHRMTCTGLYNPFFIDLLFEMFNQTDSEMYQFMKYPDPIAHSRKSIRKELKHYKPWLKRKDYLQCFKYYNILKSININIDNNIDDNINDNINDNNDKIQDINTSFKSDSSRLSDVDLESLNSDKEVEELEEIDDEEMTRK